MVAFTHDEQHTGLPGEVHRQVWNRISARLERGDALITNEDYHHAVLTEYAAITGSPASDSLRDLFRQAVRHYNTHHPDRFVAQGIQNGVTRAFQTGVDKLRWNAVAIESAGERTIARFKSLDVVRGLLDQLKVAPARIDSTACVRHAIEVVSGAKKPLVKRPLSEPLAPPKPQAPAAPPVPEAKSDDARDAIRAGEISENEAVARQQEQDRYRSQILRQEVARAARHVESFVEQGYITSEEGETVRRLQQIDERKATEEIDESEAERLRNSLMTKGARAQLERKLQSAVDYSVRFLQVFEAMKRISDSTDKALRFLIRCKDILDPAQSAEARRLAVAELLEDRELLAEVVDVMDRRDHELRMISVCLPPYSYVAKRGNEKIGNLVISEEFVDELRSLTPDSMSDRLNSEDIHTRVRPAADMKCLIAIVDHLIKPTAWRKEIRLLKIRQSIEDFYRSTDDLGEARQQAESFLNRRVRRMFKDLTPGERAAISEQGAQWIDTIEKQVLAERRAPAAREVPDPSDPGILFSDDAASNNAASNNAVSNDAASTDGELADADDLSEEEKLTGAQIGRVEIRVAGQMRRIPCKIIVDPDDPEVYVVAQRDPDSDELAPMVRRGAKRIVARDRDGTWRAAA